MSKLCPSNNNNNKCISNSQNCLCHSQSASVSQSLDELDFERGIWSAAQFGELERLEKLIESGKYTVNQTDSAGYSALHYAARNGQLSICRYLLNHGADINCCTRAGHATPLHRAAYTGNFEIVKLLVNANADVDLKDSDGKTALDKALENKHEQIYEFLMPKMKTTAKSNF